MENQTSQLGCYSVPTYVSAQNLHFELEGVNYRWNGSFSSILESYEEGIKVGEVRMIVGIPFYACKAIDKHFVLLPFLKRKQEIWWTIPDAHISAEWIRNFKKAIFSN